MLRRASVRPPGPFQAWLENPEGVQEPRVAARKEQEPHVAVRMMVQPPNRPRARRAREDRLGAHLALLNQPEERRAQPHVAVRGEEHQNLQGETYAQDR